MYSTIVQILSSNIILQFHHGVTIYIYTGDSHSLSLTYENTSVLANISKPNIPEQATMQETPSDTPHSGDQSEGSPGARDICCSHVHPRFSMATKLAPVTQYKYWVIRR